MLKLENTLAPHFTARAGGWLIDLTQADYNTRTIDTTQPFEAGATSGGTQALQTLNFSVT